MLKQPITQSKFGLMLFIALMLLLIPISLVGTQVNLFALDDDRLTQWLVLLTHSAGKEGFLLTLVVLIGWTWYRVPECRRQWLDKAMQLGVLLVLAMILKTGLKHVTQSPRPYTEVMTQSLTLPSPQHFYRLDSQQQALAMEQMNGKVSSARLAVWEQERDYSFPSGHTVFAALCLLFFGGIWLEQKHRLSALLLLAWSGAIAFSRLWVGMHRPEDLFAAALLIGALYIVVPKQYPWAWRYLPSFLRYQKQ
ncbi:phosphatase PAP2 family protein [Vibrio metschnikovii]|uniref:phosphatase PAP2 family protein n=1 Tax=Vibrio metschnikovii TaxID=28172 RepID=UPI0027DF06F6|nr:phosphatase PAP2 family protein [Vibrio metschnikovii]